MKHKLVIYLLLSVLFITACGKNNENKSILSKSDKELMVHKKREKSFGSYDYNNIEGEEAINLLENKFKLHVPAIYSDSVKLLASTFEKDVKKTEEKHSIHVEQNEVFFEYTCEYYDNKNQLLTANKIYLIYVYDQLQKEAKLWKQSVTINGGEGYSNPKYLEEKLPALAVGFSKMMKIDDFGESLSTYKREVEKAKGNTSNQSYYLFENGQQANENRSLQKLLSVTYGTTDIKEMVVYLKDMTVN